MVVVEHGGTVGFDVIGPDCSFDEGVAFSICEVIECLYKLSEFVPGFCASGVGEMVPCDLCDNHMSFVPPGASAEEDGCKQDDNFHVYLDYLYCIQL